MESGYEKNTPNAPRLKHPATLRSLSELLSQRMGWDAKGFVKKITPPQVFGSPGTNSNHLGGSWDIRVLGNVTQVTEISHMKLICATELDVFRELQLPSSCPAQPQFLFFGDVRLSLPRLAGVVGYRSSAEAQETWAGFHRKEKWFDHVWLLRSRPRIHLWTAFSLDILTWNSM